jgi:ubiquinone/menaquinone biosynthesis C-methylase UbiE
MEFSTVAGGWDTERRIRRAGIIADEIARSIQINDSYNALEFGCGTGLVSLYLSDRFKYITLVDSSEGMIDVLKRKIRDADISNMTAVLSDICNRSGNSQEQLRAESFDVIYTSMAMHHVKDIIALLDIFYSLLKPGGYLCIIDLDRDDGSFHKLEKEFDGHNGFDQTALKSMLEGSSISCISSRTFYSDRKIIEYEEVPYSLFIMIGTK